MEALERYLKAVKPFLPKGQQDEILRELGENLRSEIAEKEVALGRPLDEGECESVLDEHGPPLLVASRYRQNHRTLTLGVELIGPDLFPHYLKALSIPLAITALLFIVLAMRGARFSFGQILFPMLVQVVVVTGIFIAIEFAHRRHHLLDRWKRSSPPANELLRRYLHAVRFWLPAAQQDDILAEVVEDIRSKIEEREAELGRKLNETEVAAVLKQRGRPMLVASSYLPQEVLVTPALYPAYRFVVKLVVLWILLPSYLVIVGPMAARAATNPVLAWSATLWGLCMASIFALGAVTLAFAIMQRFPQRAVYDWDPRQLPPVPAKSATDPAVVPRYLAVAEIVMGIIAGVAWVYIMRYHSVLDVGDIRISPTFVWQGLFWPILVASVSGVFSGAAGLLWRSTPKVHSSVRLASDGLNVIIIAILLNASSWVQVTAAAMQTKALEDTTKAIDFGVWITLIVLGIVVIADGFQEARRIFSKRTTGLSALNGMAA